MAAPPVTNAPPGSHTITGADLAPAVLTMLSACGSSKKSAKTATAPTLAATTTQPASTGTTSANSGAGDWLMAQRDETRSGVATGLPDLSKATRRWTSPKLDGEVYGQPLVVGGQVIVATGHDTVYSFEAATGKQRWSAHIGTPVPGRSLPCGNVDPVGITSTPAVNPGTGLVYA